MNTYVKFGAVVVIVIGVLGWLAMGDQAHGKRLRVGGDVEQGSIMRNGGEVSFVLHQDALKLKVVYNGIDPLPDTFKDGAQALADGKLGPDGIFQASKIQAKRASKYEAKPQLKKDPSQVGI